MVKSHFNNTKLLLSSRGCTFTHTHFYTYALLYTHTQLQQIIRSFIENQNSYTGTFKYSYNYE